MHLTIDDVQPLPLDSKDKVKEIFAMLDDIGIAHKQNLCQFIQHSDGDVTCTPLLFLETTFIEIAVSL
jgi:hypothetical protein